MAIDKPTWFPVHVGLFLSDAQVEMMNTEELGAALRLLCRQWTEGALPDDVRLLARIARLDDERMRSAWTVLEPFFPKLNNGSRANRWLWAERERVLAEMERRSDGASRAAQKRWEDARSRRGDGASHPKSADGGDASDPSERRKPMRGASNTMRDALPDASNSMRGAMQEVEVQEEIQELQEPPIIPLSGDGVFSGGTIVSESPAVEPPVAPEPPAPPAPPAPGVAADRKLGGDDVVGIWNTLTANTTLPAARLISKRQKHINARLREKGWIDDYRAAVAYVASSPFYCGGNDRAWFATIDLLLRPGKATELAERARSTSSGPQRPRHGTKSPAHRARADQEHETVLAAVEAAGGVDPYGKNRALVGDDHEDVFAVPGAVRGA